MEWKPATIEDVVQLIQDDLANCNREQTAAFDKYRVEPHLSPIARSGNIERVVVVARKGNEVIYWEDVEEGFGVSSIEENGKICEQDCNQNDLGLALDRLKKRL